MGLRCAPVLHLGLFYFALDVGHPPDALQVEVSGRGAHVLRGEEECCEKESEPLGLYKHRFKSELFPWPGMWPWAADSSSLPPFPHL